MEHYFPKGAKPELDAAVATAFIAAGAAESFDDPNAAQFVSTAEIMLDVKVS